MKDTTTCSRCKSSSFCCASRSTIFIRRSKVHITYKLATIMIPEIFFDRSKDVSIATIVKNLDPEDRNINILNLKIYSILYSVILNDFDRVYA